MTDLIKWWIFFEFIGWLVFPICFSLFKNQLDKGYSFSKTIALLIWGYIYWISNTFGIIGNERAGAIFALIIIFIISALYLSKNKLFSEIYVWIKSSKKIILSIEVLFLFSVLFMVLMRGANPEIIGTEKPMELTFINGILKSTLFPPNDPWLSGYSISYYYFGYLIVSAIIKVIGTDSGVAFNLALVFWFALISIGSFGILLNLLAGKNRQINEKLSRKQINKILFSSLTAPLFLLLLGNGEGMLELIHSRGLFWKTNPGGGMDSVFWRWLDIKELSQPPPLPLDWKISRSGGTWWWRASRILQDYTLKGQSREVIDEFPFFSFFLGDLHPHVLAMPFVLLCIFSGYAFFINKSEQHSDGLENIYSFWKSKNNWFFTIVLGSLIFLNTWDFPVYLCLTMVLLFFNTYRKNVPIRKIIVEILSIIFSLGIICILLYSPFLLSFSSQAGGILPSLVFQSRSIHLFIMFLPFIVITLIYLLFRYGVKLPILHIFKNWILVFIGYISILIISLFIPFILGVIPNFFASLQEFSMRNYENAFQQSLQQNISFLSIYEASGSFQLITETISKIFSDPADILIMLFLICIVISIGTSYLRNTDHKNKISKQDLFIGCLVFLGIGLVLFPEVFYLRDQFGWRMNTIFKFYFQAWILLSISSAYAVGQIGTIKSVFLKNGIKVVCVLGILVGLIYPIFAIKESMIRLGDETIILDGNQYLEKSNPDEYEAIRILDLANYGVVSEAVGGSYTNFGRVSKITGLPTVLGWPGHEVQWRGGSEEIGSREFDIKELYSTNNWISAKSTLDKYNIRYVYIGDLERTTYQVSEEKFKINLSIYYENQSVVIYEYESVN